MWKGFLLYHYCLWQEEIGISDCMGIQVRSATANRHNPQHVELADCLTWKNSNKMAKPFCHALYNQHPKRGNHQGHCFVSSRSVSFQLSMHLLHFLRLSLFALLLKSNIVSVVKKHVFRFQDWCYCSDIPRGSIIYPQSRSHLLEALQDEVQPNTSYLLATQPMRAEYLILNIYSLTGNTARKFRWEDEKIKAVLPETQRDGPLF